MGRPLSQEEKILRCLRQHNRWGATNYQLSRIALKYSSRIAELRKDGYNITAVRQRLSNGRMSNTWRYFINDTED